MDIPKDKSIILSSADFQGIIISNDTKIFASFFLKTILTGLEKRA